jgi:hypothetical protein
MYSISAGSYSHMSTSQDCLAQDHGRLQPDTETSSTHRTPTIRHTDRVELLLETLHTDHIHLLVLGEIKDLGDVQRRGKARVEKLVLSTFMNSKGRLSICRRTSGAPECDAKLTSVVSIPKSSKVFLYIGRLLLALFETNRTFLPAITIARSACYTFSTHIYKRATQLST